MSISNLFSKLIWLGLALGWSGTIAKVTSQLMHGAAQTQMMSLGKWNRTLLGQK